VRQCVEIFDPHVEMFCGAKYCITQCHIVMDIVTAPVWTMYTLPHPTQLVHDLESCNNTEQESKRAIHLGDCMQLFTATERLSKKDAWLVHTLTVWHQ